MLVSLVSLGKSITHTGVFAQHGLESICVGIADSILESHSIPNHQIYRDNYST